jgi:hypothetical protein
MIKKNITKEMLKKLNKKLWIFYIFSLGFGAIAVYVLQSRGPGLISLISAGVLQIIIIQLWKKKLGNSENQKQANNGSNSNVGLNS